MAERTQALQKEISAKELLLKEVHHRVKNNMQIISSLLKIQATSVQDPQYRLLLDESTMRIRSMAYIHEKLYQSGDLTEINIKEYIDRLTHELIHSYSRTEQPVEFVNNADNVGLTLDIAVPCGLIINELVSNSLKHAFVETTDLPHLTINFRESSSRSEYHLSIVDNGVGFPENFDISTSTTMGIDIVRMLTKQLGGDIELKKRPKTRFEITFPKNQ